MDRKESLDLQKALLTLTKENNTKEKAVALFQSDGYFDQDGKLAQGEKQ